MMTDVAPCGRPTTQHQVRGEGLPKGLWDVTVHELFFGREASAGRAGLHGLLGMDACVIAGPARERETVLLQNFVAPLMRAMTQVALEERLLPAGAAATPGGGGIAPSVLLMTTTAAAGVPGAGPAAEEAC